MNRFILLTANDGSIGIVDSSNGEFVQVGFKEWKEAKVIRDELNRRSNAETVEHIHRLQTQVQ